MSGVAGRADGCIQGPHTLPCCLKHSRAGRLLTSPEHFCIQLHKETRKFKMATKANRSTAVTKRDGEKNKIKAARISWKFLWTKRLST